MTIPHSGFVANVVAVCINHTAPSTLTPILDSARNNGWHKLVNAIERIIQGERSNTLLDDLDSEEEEIISNILLQLESGHTELSTPKLSENNSQGLAIIINAAINGDSDAQSTIAFMCKEMESVGGELTMLSSAIRKLLAGERDLIALSNDMSLRSKRLLSAVLKDLSQRR